MEIVIVKCDRIEEWSALYVNGKLEKVGEHYLVVERALEITGVQYLQGDFLLGGNQTHNVAHTLKEIQDHDTRVKEKKDAERARLLQRLQETQAALDALGD